MNIQLLDTRDIALIGSSNGAWLGRKGTIHTFHANKSKFGLRAVALVYDDGEIEVKVIRGDGRTQKFETLFERSGRDVTPANQHNGVDLTNQALKALRHAHSYSGESV